MGRCNARHRRSSTGNEACDLPCSMSLRCPAEMPAPAAMSRQRRSAPASLLAQPGADLVLQVEPGHAVAVRVGHQNNAGQDTISSSSGSSARQHDGVRLVSAVVHGADRPEHVTVAADGDLGRAPQNGEEALADEADVGRVDRQVLDDHGVRALTAETVDHAEDGARGQLDLIAVAGAR